MRRRTFFKIAEKSKKGPFVSIIIPTYQEENYIEPTLKSLKLQDYQNGYEIIVVDSKSTDKTVEIARKYADKVVLIEEKNVSVARNVGAKKAKGEILVFIDADTVATYNLIKELVNGFKRNVVGVACPIVPLSTSFFEFVLFWLYNQFIKFSLHTKRPQVTGLCCAYTKNALKKVGGFDEKTKVFEDFDLSERISKLGKIAYVDTTFVQTSVRRIRKWGKIKSVMKYVKFYLKYILTEDSPSVEEYNPVR